MNGRKTRSQKDGAQALPGDARAPDDFRSLGISRYFGSMMILIDVALIASVFIISYYLRFHLEFLVIKHVPTSPIADYVKGAILLTGAWVFFNWRDGLYAGGLRHDGSPLNQGRRLIVNGVCATALMMVFSYLYRDLLLSRQVYLMTTVLTVPCLIAVRSVARSVAGEMGKKGVSHFRALVAGTDGLNEFVEELRQRYPLIEFVGFVMPPGEPPSQAYKQRNGLEDKRVAGAMENIASILEAEHVDYLVVTQSLMERLEETEAEATEKEGTAPISVLNACEAAGVSLFMIPNAFDVSVSHEEVGSLAGVPLLHLRDAAIHPMYAVIKRTMDIAVSLSVITVGLPVWLFVMWRIHRADGGPAFFTQTRIGLHGKPFKMYKFRSMYIDAEERLKELVNVDELDVPGFKIKNDPRVTTVGKFLRRTSLDELPQLINVLKGEMSVIGPRPEMPDLVARYNALERRRLKARPGLTGYQQIHARGEPLAAKHCIRYDLSYLKNQSLLMDIYILWKTIWVVVRGDGVTY